MTSKPTTLEEEDSDEVCDFFFRKFIWFTKKHKKLDCLGNFIAWIFFGCILLLTFKVLKLCSWTIAIRLFDTKLIALHTHIHLVCFREKSDNNCASRTFVTRERSSESWLETVVNDRYIGEMRFSSLFMCNWWEHIAICCILVYKYLYIYSLCTLSETSRERAHKIKMLEFPASFNSKQWEQRELHNRWRWENFWRLKVLQVAEIIWWRVSQQ